MNVTNVSGTNLAPTNATWVVSPTTGSAVDSLSGTITSTEGSHGKLKVDYDGKSNTAAQQLSFVKASFTVAAVKEGEPAEVNITVTGIESNKLTYALSASPTASGTPQNALGHQDMTFSQPNAQQDLKWQIDSGIWYGVPGNLCYNYASPYEVKLDVSYQGEVVCTATKDITVDGNLPGGIGTRHDPRPPTFRSQIGNPTAVQGVANWFVCTLQILEYQKSATSFGLENIPENHQYASLIRDEEEFHVDQLNGNVAREEGGCGDLYTRKGALYLQSMAARPRPG